MLRRLLPVLLLAPLTAGCISTAASIVTAPVRVAGKAVDWTTTSQSEADERRGRNLRKREAELGKLDRQYRKHSRECQAGSQRACDQARTEYEQMQRISPSVPNLR